MAKQRKSQYILYWKGELSQLMTSSLLNGTSYKVINDPNLTRDSRVQNMDNPITSKNFPYGSEKVYDGY
jgi:hypothetical protein